MRKTPIPASQRLAVRSRPLIGTGLKLRIMDISTTRIRNQFPGKIVEIIRGPHRSEVDIATTTGILTSVIENRLLDQIGLKTGDQVVAFVKSQDVRLATV